MSFFASIAEEKIREAIQKGEFDHLPGKGQPLSPDDLAGVPDELRLGYKLLKNAGMIPEEMQLRKEMVTLEDLISICRDETERLRLHRELSVKKLRYQALMQERNWQASGAFRDYAHKMARKLAGY